MTYVLSRLDLIKGKIDERTPNIVIQEIAESLRITSTDKISFKNKRILSLIYETKPRVIEEPFDVNKLTHIARYVNPQVSSWKENKLREAFQSLWNRRELCLEMIDLDFNCQPQTPDNPRGINSCLLYRLCREGGINTDPEMSYLDLVSAVKALLTPRTELLEQICQHLLDDGSPDLINVYMYVNRKKESKRRKILPTKVEITHQDLEKHVDLLINSRELLKRLTIYQPGEAIAIAAYEYSLDLSSSAFPYRELDLLRKCTGQAQRYSGPDDYIPFDPNLKKYYLVNPRLYSLNAHFNPLFPERYYPSVELSSLLEESGYPTGSVLNRYNQLSEIYLYNSFYHGLRPGFKNRQSPFDYTEVEEVNSNSLVSFGNPNDGFIFYTYEELGNFFRACRDFLHPYEKGVRLSSEDILRLKILASNKFYPHDHQKSEADRNYLLETLTYVEIITDQNQGMIGAFLEKYNLSSGEKKEEIKELFASLFFLSMFMRGWEGGEDVLPIERAPYKEAGEVSLRVSAGISVYEKRLEDLDSSWIETISNLPLVRYDNSFILSTEPSIGQTIGDKIRIIKAGENHPDPMGSCIRASSGWLACSAYRYMVLIGMGPPFDINRLAYIT